MTALAAAGRNVVHLQSGTRYSLRRSRQYIVRRPPYQVVERFVLVNSVVRAPAVFELAAENRRYAGGRDEEMVSQAAQAGLVCDWLAAKGVSEVWIHSLEGQPVGLLGALAARGHHIALFCHDHYYVCPRVTLLYQGQAVCTDYHAGSRCLSCTSARFARGFETRSALSGLPIGLGSLASWILSLRDRRFQRRASRHRSDAGVADSESTTELLDGLGARVGSDAPASRRHVALGRALDAVDAIYCPSSFVAESLSRIGVEESRIHRVRIGLPHIDRLRSARRDTPAERPVRFAYHGTAVPHKGLWVLCDAVQTLSPDIRARARFVVRGVRRSDGVSVPNGIEMMPPYHSEDLPGVVDTYDIGISPHLWFENSPLTILEHLAAGKPVIASSLGGVVDYVRPGETGWLVDPGSATSLAALISRIVDGREPIPTVPPEATSTFNAFLDSLA